MEIKMVQCTNGHYFNAALHNCCPDCGMPALTSAGNAEVGIGHTEPVGGSGIGHTEPVGGYGEDTINIQNPLDADVDGFGVTMIGGDSVEGRPEPVVGWLVCIEGLSRGVDYRLHAGYNYIGREVGDVHIHGDNQISRKNHAMIAYDSSERTYYVGPSAGRNLIKVNGKTVLNAV